MFQSGIIWGGEAWTSTVQEQAVVKTNWLLTQWRRQQRFLLFVQNCEGELWFFLGGGVGGIGERSVKESCGSCWGEVLVVLVKGV